MMIFINDFLIILKKVLKILFNSEMLNFFCLFIMFRMSFLIICRNNFTACSYSKSFMLLKLTCDFSEKKLHYNMSAFFSVV